MQKEKNDNNIERLKFETAQEFGLAHRKNHGRSAANKLQKNKDGKRF